MNATERIAATAIDRVMFGRAPEKVLDDMTIEELEARFRVLQERQGLLWWAGFAAGFGGGAFGGYKLVAAAGRTALMVF